MNNDQDVFGIDQDNGLSPDAMGISMSGGSSSVPDTVRIAKHNAILTNITAPAPPQQVWVCKFGYTIFNSIVCGEGEPMKNIKAEECKRRLAAGWRVHTLAPLDNGYTMFVVLVKD